MSVRAKALQKELSLPFGSAVTLTTKGVLLPAAGSDGGGGSFSFLPEGLESLRLFLEFADVFLLVQVQEGARGDAEKEAVLALLRAGTGVVRGGSSNEGVAEHVRIYTYPYLFMYSSLTHSYIYIHPQKPTNQKILFYSTPIGKQAIVRQLRPQLHIDHDRAVVTNLVPHISRLLLVDGSFADRLDSVAFRVLASLDNLLVLLPPSAEESGESGSGAVPAAAAAAAAQG